MFQYMQSAEETADEIANLYQKSSEYLSHEMDQIFKRFKTKHHLSEAEAYRLLNTLQDKTAINELKAALKAGTGGRTKADILAELESPAYQTRLERLKQLQNQLDLVMRQVYEQENIRNTSHYVDLANEAYYRSIFDIQQQTGVGFSFGLVDPKIIDQVINSKWSGTNYSARIWHNTRALTQDLKRELLISLITGRTDRETAELFANKFAAGASQARRLIRTESCNLATQMDMAAYEECGITKYRFVATLDLRTSAVCRKLDGKVFLVSEQQPGKNCPPMHPWCRSTTVCELKDEEVLDMQRRARDPVTGKTYMVPVDMTYEQWYETYVNGRPGAELNEKMIKNCYSDRRQFEQYHEILGKDMPRTLDSFQKMKYTEQETYEFRRLDYSRRKKLIDHPELKLPNSEKVIVPDEKFTRYLLGGENKKGRSKGRAITSRLGYDISNWQELQDEIKQKVARYPATMKGEIEYGIRYEQKMILYGKKGTPANVIVGWLQWPDGSMRMTSAYIKEV
ncbi:phage head morphogenesis protein [Clostridium sp. AM58-1XD]|nr:phage head morphogenesis protein [Clostridium sp. AM58-1XD]